MNYQKLSDAIRLCGSTPKIDQCKAECPYYAGGDMTKCIPVLTKDAADAIIELKSNIDLMGKNRIGVLQWKIILLLLGSMYV